MDTGLWFLTTNFALQLYVSATVAKLVLKKSLFRLQPLPAGSSVMVACCCCILDLFCLISCCDFFESCWSLAANRSFMNFFKLIRAGFFSTSTNVESSSMLTSMDMEDEDECLPLVMIFDSSSLSSRKFCSELSRDPLRAKRFLLFSKSSSSRELCEDTEISLVLLSSCLTATR